MIRGKQAVLMTLIRSLHVQGLTNDTLTWFLAQKNYIMFSLTWSIAPVLVSVISFTAYIYTGHQLTVSVAFTAVQIFSMIKGYVLRLLAPDY